ncbi:hypothetical protein [Lapidilactobacillus wuchangensis]|uniref:hypothetical protein n=1 Tax=Lapidilactobacillus wuchangensis TaxID=2486001 RepID=UPI000F768C18|nr:hypothetical protein [Lapidilactobacillus wuchangensis]
MNKRHQNQEPDMIIDVHQPAAATDSAEPTPGLSRVARQEALQRQGQASTYVAHPKMRRKLNWTILIVSVLIVIAYLVLFFV